jgi:hypothetical protein
MSTADALFRDLLPLAGKIACGYANVPGMTAADVRACGSCRLASGRDGL